VLKNFWLVSCLLLFNSLQANYTYEANQSLYDLHDNANNFQGELAYEVVDDGVSPAIDLSFNFTFYGSTFSQARMSTNGCLHFGNSGNYCNDYTPDPINGQHTYTLYPFWTDLIRDNDSRMKSWGDSSKMIFGWYKMREYNRASDNSFEIILWNNNSFDFRYRELDIINHDVLIGEVGSNASNSYTYLYHDECGTGTTNSSTCVNQNWNSTSFNTTLENGGSLYGLGSGNSIDCSDPLNDSSCAGYAAAYLTQQCNLDALYSTDCTGYDAAYLAQQCGLDALYSTDCTGYEEALRDYECDQDPQFSPTCSGYIPEVLAVMVTQNGYDEPETYQITEDEVILYTEPYEDFNEEEAFEEFNFNGLIDDEFYIDPIDDFDPIVESISLVSSVDVIDVIDVFDAEELVEVFTTNDLLANTEELIQLFEFETIIREELEQEQEQEPQSEPVEVVEIIEEIEETIEIAENDEEVIEELEEETEELIAEETSSRGGITSTMLNVVRNTISAASSSFSNTSASNSTNSVANNNASSSSGISTSNSPSMSEQITSANAQNNMVLSLNTATDDVSSGQTQSVTTIITPLATLDSSPQVVMAEVQVQNMQGEIDTAVSGVMTQSEADQIADQIIANNIKEQQEELQEESQETGEYADQSTLVAYLGYVPAFEVYKGYEMPKQNNWYTPRDIYADAVINDNNQAFYGLSTESYNTLSEMIQSQPNL
tara:strand:+ start:2662 stop:4803 length:2142 start_codon:yes stop_codon:yes gene_type:complete